MNTSIRTRTAAGFAAALTIAASFSLAGSASAPRFYQDDPVWVEHDTENAAGLTPLDVDLVTDLAWNLVVGSEPREPKKAMNLNSVDDTTASWFTNRLGRQPITARDVERRPDRNDGPAPSRGRSPRRRATASHRASP